MAKATIIHLTKFYIIHKFLKLEGVVELKIWKVPISFKYPEGIKYSLFCVDIMTKEDDFYEELRKRGYEI